MNIDVSEGEDGEWFVSLDVGDNNEEEDAYVEVKGDLNLGIICIDVWWFYILVTELRLQVLDILCHGLWLYVLIVVLRFWDDMFSSFSNFSFYK